jgi:hypothetical protein
VVSGITFYFNSTFDTFDNSEAGCALGGGHLATYTSIEEQSDVEGYVSLRAGALLLSRRCCAAAWHGRSA